jgi:trimethylamine--corrinoid protein Co-methyltransferase
LITDDVHHRLAPVYEFAEMIANTGKPVLPWAYSVENVSDIYQIALAVAGSEEALRRRPFFALFATFQAPLQHTDEDLANVLWAAGHDVPIVYLGGGSAGATAPVTGAGTLVISLAGALSGLAIIQLKKRGAAVCIGGVPQPMDLRTGRPAYGGPEMSLYSAAMSDISRYLGLPFMGTAGASEAKLLDPQAAIESTVQVVLSGLSGAALVHDVGFLDCADIGSLEMLVMNDEIIAMARRVMRGVEVSDDTLMLDLIDLIGPGGEFMSAKETARQCRDEIWVPTLMDREPWENWEAAGSQTMNDRVKARLREILATHEPPPLPDGAAERIEAILQAAEARAGKDHA